MGELCSASRPGEEEEEEQERLVPQRSVDRVLAQLATVEPEQEANPNKDQKKTGSEPGHTVHLPAEQSKTLMGNLSPVNPPVAQACSANTRLENSIAGIPA